MTPTEAAQLLAVMASPHRVEVTDDLMEVWWQTAFERCDFQTGLDAAMAIVETSEFMAKPATFNGKVAELRRSAYLAELADKAAENGRLHLGTGEGVESPEEQRARFFQMWRAAVAEAEAKGPHDHRHGPDRPCRRCGGHDPYWNRRGRDGRILR